MWLYVVRQPRADAPYWSGRRWVAAIDAVVWPLLWVYWIRQIPGPAGLVGPVLCAVALLCALLRLHQALWENHRYWFTTWRWARVAFLVLVFGVALKFMMPA